MKDIHQAYGFDDVTVGPGSEHYRPADVNTKTRITRNIEVAGPIIASEGPHVSIDLAIELACKGGVAIMSGREPIEDQMEKIEEVKRRQNIVIYNPYIVSPDMPLRDAVRLMEEKKISGILVAYSDKILKGILTNRDVRFAEEGMTQRKKLFVRDVMKTDLVTGWPGISLEEAKDLLKVHKKEKLPLVDQNGRIAGLDTLKDMDNLKRFHDASRDRYGRLRVGAGIELTPDIEERAEKLIEAGADFLSLLFSRGNLYEIVRVIQRLKRMDRADLVVGNVANGEVAKMLCDAGADAIVVDGGSSSMSIKERVSGVALGQITAIMTVVDALGNDIPVIAAGGIRGPGEITKATAAGASAVKIGALFAGVKESAAEEISAGGRLYKSYSGRDIAAAFDPDIRQYTDQNTLVPEGFDGMVPYAGELGGVYDYLINGFKQGMADVGCRTVEELRIKGKLFRASRRGSGGIIMTREAKDFALLEKSAK